jgi:D-glycero-D-manno-heptose 1,7-bisphosphate phosphatase
MKKAAFLDRDGVINRKPPEGQYVTRWEQMDFFPAACNAVCMLNRAGFLVIVVTNQRCVAQGFLTTEEMDFIHARMCREFGAVGATIHAVYYCSHEIQPPCSCRKPQPGMLLHAAQKHGVDLAASWMIGDSQSDVEAGRAAGCKTARVIGDNKFTDCAADVVASSLFDATCKILQITPGLLQYPPHMRAVKKRCL